MIRVVVADDHNLVRQGLRSLLEQAPEIEVIAEAEDGDRAVALAYQLRPDVVLMDLSMPGLGGIQAMEKILASQPETRVVILSMHNDESLVERALRLGARGYVLKNAALEELLLAIRAGGILKRCVNSMKGGVSSS